MNHAIIQTGSFAVIKVTSFCLSITLHILLIFYKMHISYA